jgi:hypothetical protein
MREKGVTMPELTTIVDTTTDQIIRENAKKESVSLSRYLNNLIQRSLALEENAESITSIIHHSQLLTAYKKTLAYCLESLVLTQYLVKNLGDETFKVTNEAMLQKAHDHAMSYVGGLFEE